MLIHPFRPGAGDLGYPPICEKIHARNQKKQNPVETYIHEVSQPLDSAVQSSEVRSSPSKTLQSFRPALDATFAPIYPSLGRPVQAPWWSWFQPCLSECESPQNPRKHSDFHEPRKNSRIPGYRVSSSLSSILRTFSRNRNRTRLSPQMRTVFNP